MLTSWNINLKLKHRKKPLVESLYSTLYIGEGPGGGGQVGSQLNSPPPSHPDM